MRFAGRRLCLLHTTELTLVDIAVNLTDPQWEGVYHSRQCHPPDIDAVVARAKGKGVERMLVTGTSLSESRRAVELGERYDLHCTAGVHPTSTGEIDGFSGGVDGYMRELRALIDADRGEGGGKRIISIGEIGLDYDRLHHASKETQLKQLPALLALGKEYRLPLFLHSRTSEAHVDLMEALRGAAFGVAAGWRGGLVHSFTGTREEVRELVEMGLYIGINGCSLKTSENLEAVKEIPIDRLLLETDSPWCSVTSSHASSAFLPPPTSALLVEKVSKPQNWKEGFGVKGRMEPAEVGVIAWIVARVRGVEVEELAERAWENGERLFWGAKADQGGA